MQDDIQYEASTPMSCAPFGQESNWPMMHPSGVLFQSVASSEMEHDMNEMANFKSELGVSPLVDVQMDDYPISVPTGDFSAVISSEDIFVTAVISEGLKAQLICPNCGVYLFKIGQFIKCQRHGCLQIDMGTEDFDFDTVVQELMNDDF